MIWMTLAQALIPGLVKRLTTNKGKVVQDVAQIALEATGLAPETSEDDVLLALKADPEVFARVQEAAASVAIAELETEIAGAQIAASDRAGARALYSEEGARSPMVIAACVIVGLFATVTALMLVPVPEGAQDAIVLVLGALLGMLSSIVSFFFGSSQSSKDKTAHMMRLK